MGPIELVLRGAGERLMRGWALPVVISPVSTVREARMVVYHADMQLREDRGEPGHELARGLSEIVSQGDLGEVLTEAIVAAEALGL